MLILLTSETKKIFERLQRKMIRLALKIENDNNFDNN